MKAIVTILFIFCSTTIVLAQTQLDIQGNPARTDTVAKIKVNYSGPIDVVGLSVYSAPFGEEGFYGIGGAFFGGSRGLIGNSNRIGVEGKGKYQGIIGMHIDENGQSIYSLAHCGVQGSSWNGYGVIGLSVNNSGIYGESSYVFGVYGISYDSIGVCGKSTNSSGIYGHSVNGIGVNGVSDNSSANSGK
jgi:hypothetical protein